MAEPHEASTTCNRTADSTEVAANNTAIKGTIMHSHDESEVVNLLYHRKQSLKQAMSKNKSN